MLKEAVRSLLGSIEGTVTPEHIRSTIEKYLQTYVTKDTATRAAMFTDDAIADDPVGAPPFVGKEAIVNFWSIADQGPATLEPKVERIVVCGNEAVFIFNMKMSVGEMGSATMKITETLVFDDAGKIKRLRAYWDEHSVT